MKNLTLLLLMMAVSLFACKEDPVPPVPVQQNVSLTTGGPNQENQLYFDLGSGNQYAVARDSWDFGFYCGAEDAVILNGSVGMLARSTNIANFADVSPTDTLGWGYELSFGGIQTAYFENPQPAWVADAAGWMDDQTDNLVDQAIKADGKVYIVNMGKTVDGLNDRVWKKVKVDMVAGAYVVEYGDIDATTAMTATITKNTSKSYSFLSLANGAMDVEFEKSDWDIVFTTASEIVNYGAGPLPYAITKDYVLNNRNVEIFQVVTTADIVEHYEAFSMDSVANYTFSMNDNFIGSKWRKFDFATSSYSIKADRFYVIKDEQGLYFKLVFTGMLNETGERGYPAIQYIQIL